MTYTFKLSRRLAASHLSRRAVVSCAAFAFGLLASACGGGDLTAPLDPPKPNQSVATPGWVPVRLNTPNTDDGAVQFSVSGISVDSVRLAGYRGYARVSNGAAQVLVTGTIVSGVVAEIWIKDTKKASLYTGQVSEAAARGTYQLREINQGYSVQVGQ